MRPADAGHGTRPSRGWTRDFRGENGGKVIGDLRFSIGDLVEPLIFGLKTRVETGIRRGMVARNPRFWVKNKGWEIETSTNVQKGYQILRKRGKGGGKGGQDGQKGGRKIYEKSARGRKKG